MGFINAFVNKDFILIQIIQFVKNVIVHVPFVILICVYCVKEDMERQ